MIFRAVLSAIALFIAVLIEDAFVSALPEPLNLIAVVFTIGVLLFHFVKPHYGAAWLVAGGAALDLVALPGPSRTVAYALAALLGLFLARKVFSNRSLYALLGLGVSMFAGAIIVESIWYEVLRLIVSEPVAFSALLQAFWTRLLTFAITVFVAYFLSRRSVVFFQKLFFLRT